MIKILECLRQTFRRDVWTLALCLDFPKISTAGLDHVFNFFHRMCLQRWCLFSQRSVYTQFWACFANKTGCTRKYWLKTSSNQVNKYTHHLIAKYIVLIESRNTIDHTADYVKLLPDAPCLPRLTRSQIASRGNHSHGLIFWCRTLASTEQYLDHESPGKQSIFSNQESRRS